MTAQPGAEPGETRAEARARVIAERAVLLARGSDEWSPPTPRDAATVCLLRDGVDGLEVFLLRRAPGLAFAPGMSAFPGGAVDPGDATPDVELSGGWEALAKRAATTAPRALLGAAVRETFEEAAVLLAGDAGGEPPATDGRFEPDRLAVLEGRLVIQDLLALRGLAIDPASLHLMGHWITPAVQDKRFDTRFFVARMPGSQVARDVGGESDRAAWVRPAVAADEHARGELPMLAPTLATVRWLAQYDDVAAAIAAAEAAVVRPLLPWPALVGDDAVRWLLTDGRTGEELRSDATSVSACGDAAFHGKYATSGGGR